MNRPNAYGYTLFEILTVLSIIAIVMQLSIPLISQQIFKQRFSAVFIKLQSMVKLAQIEAIRRNSSLIICAATFNKRSTDDLYATLHKCRPRNDWSLGALVFIDLQETNDYTGSSHERIVAFRFDNYVSVKTDFRRLIIDDSGRIRSQDGNKNLWQFQLSQNKFGLSATQTLKLNGYGYLCVVGEGNC